MKKLLIIAAVVAAVGVGVVIATNPSVYVGYFQAPAPLPANSPFAYGIDGATGTDVYLAERNAHRIYRLTNNGSIVSSFAFAPNYPLGVAYDGTYVWVSRGVESGIPGVSAIYRLTTTGSQVSSFLTSAVDSASTYPTGVEWDGTYIYFCDRFTNKIYKCTTTGSRVASYTTPGMSESADPNPRDLSYDSDGTWWVQEANPAATPVWFTLYRCNSTFVPEISFPYEYWWVTGGGGIVGPSGTDGWNPRGVYHDVAANMFFISDCQYPVGAETDPVNWVFKLQSGTRIETSSMGKIKGMYR